MTAKRREGEKSKIRTLLELLDKEGNLDAEELDERTGYGKALIAATMCGAKVRGMVEAKPRDMSAPTSTSSERREESRKTRRGQVYTFVSYTSVRKTAEACVVEDPWPADLREALEGALMPNMRGVIEQLDKSAQRRVKTWM
jgi:hypothetical protein